MSLKSVIDTLTLYLKCVDNAPDTQRLLESETNKREKVTRGRCQNVLSVRERLIWPKTKLASHNRYYTWTIVGGTFSGKRCETDVARDEIEERRGDTTGGRVAAVGNIVGRRDSVENEAEESCDWHGRGVGFNRKWASNQPNKRQPSRDRRWWCNLNFLVLAGLWLFRLTNEPAQDSGWQLGRKMAKGGTDNIPKPRDSPRNDQSIGKILTEIRITAFNIRRYKRQRIVGSFSSFVSLYSHCYI